MIITLAIFTLAYTIWTIWLALQGNKLDPNYCPQSTGSVPGISIVIPFRNEESELEKCVRSIAEQMENDGNTEIIAVNDNSTDGSSMVVETLRTKYPFLRLVNLLNKEGKKAALEQGILKASHEWIITVDADTQVRKGWLEDIRNEASATDKELLVLPVDFPEPADFREIFQNLEFLSLIGSGLASARGGHPFMANGANFAFSKGLFERLNGYEGSQNISSGDDQFLLFKVLKSEPEKVGHLFTTKVTAETRPPASNTEWFAQRVRWGSKTKAYNSPYALLIAWMVFLYNLLIVVFVGMSLVEVFYLPILAFSFMLKILVDGFFLSLICGRFSKLRLMAAYPFLAIMYPFILVATALASLFWKPTWKGRTIRVKNH